MITLREGNLEHHFEDGWLASKYDEWPFYTEHFQGALGGNKAVDFVAQDPSDTLWLVELKDYRVHPRTKTIDIVDEVAVKVRDSLAGILAAARWHSDHVRQADARRHIGAKRLRVVLHLEQPKAHSKLFARKYDISRLQQKLKSIVKVVDAHPLVVELGCTDLPWTISAAAGGPSSSLGV